MRLGQKDLLDFCVNPAYVHALTWPDDYWPKEPAPAAWRVESEHRGFQGRSREAAAARPTAGGGPVRPGSDRSGPSDVPPRNPARDRPQRVSPGPAGGRASGTRDLALTGRRYSRAGGRGLPSFRIGVRQGRTASRRPAGGAVSMIRVAASTVLAVCLFGVLGPAARQQPIFRARATPSASSSP